ncbi:MAG: pantetheine-phosphate adenylyltransferase [Prevotella sp.]|nr:pantetheine-phosphate adenylyltransferase [Prevotella sp.]MBR1840075.1 pantetheine-phosphate adenylyltransferase [Prevotella sp.]
MKTAIFPGTFNPFTVGHADIVERALTIFDKVVIGVGYNPEKGDSNIYPRVAHIKEVYEDNPNVVVEAYTDLTVDLARRHDATAIVKGVRSVKDYEYEREQAEFNRMLGDGIETVLIFSRPEYTSLTSSIVRTLQHFGKDVSEYLP